MKAKNKKELDVDFIGSQEALTIAEEKAISEFIRKQKAVSEKGKQAKKADQKKAA